MKEPINVTCAIIIKDNNILITKRGEKMKFPGKWEFPGGKVEEGENEEQCLVREIKEELDLDISLEKRLPICVHDYGEVKVCLIPFIARIISGSINLIEHSEFKWIVKSDLLSIDWLAADISIAEKLISHDFIHAT